MLKAIVIKEQLEAAHKSISHLPGGPKVPFSLPNPPTQVTFSKILDQCQKNVSSASAIY